MPTETAGQREAYTQFLFPVTQTRKLQMSLTRGHKNRFNSGADADQVMQLGILTKESYCLHLLHAHYCAALRLCAKRTVLTS